MADPLAVIIRFSGDSDDLFERFEQARETWIAAQDGDYERPVFYAACKTDEGIAVISAWQTATAHRAFGQQLHAHIDAVGIGRPDQIEHAGREARLGLSGAITPNAARSWRPSVGLPLGELVPAPGWWPPHRARCGVAVRLERFLRPQGKNDLPRGRSCAPQGELPCRVARVSASYRSEARKWRRGR